MINKDITFICFDNAEVQIANSIATVAKARGYNTKITSNKFEKCEIGIYMQHINFPQYSKFSVIMLHDITQGYGIWPNIWFREPWNKYDIGILPSKQWEKNYYESSNNFYTVPKHGAYLVGWPKSDSYISLDKDNARKEFNIKYGLDNNKKTVLYAPAWENDNKQDDFVKAMLNLDVNILIKQAPWNEKEYPEQIKNINEMKKKHEGINNVYIIDSKINIFEVIQASDLLVSEESSTMTEALLMGIPSISVSDWLIPDTTPSRFPSNKYDFVIKTFKNELANITKTVLDNYDKYLTEVMLFREKTFCNLGNASNMILDIIDDCVNGKPIRYSQIKTKPNNVHLFDYIKYNLNFLRVEIAENYSKKNIFVNKTWKLLKKIKNFKI